jgi:hypothetical protein
LGDEGADLGFAARPLPPATWVDDSSQAFVKFFGEGNNRAERSMRVVDEVSRSGCHWYCAYPKGKRPRQPADGATMFMGRLVKSSSDILIFGRAIALRHQGKADDATAAHIRLRPFMKKWPHLIEVHHPEFIAGTLENGISLNSLMAELGANSFASTQRNAERGTGNTDPRRAYSQAPAVELSAAGRAWLNQRFETAMSEHGPISETQFPKA